MKRTAALIGLLLAGILFGFGIGEVTHAIRNIPKAESSTQEESQEETPEETEEEIEESSLTPEDISYETFKGKDSMYVFYYNHGDEVLSGMDTQIVFYDEEGEMLSFGSWYVDEVAPGSYEMASYSLPTDTYGTLYEYSDMKITYTISKEKSKNRMVNDQVELQSNVSKADKSILIRCTNTGEESISNVEITGTFTLNGEFVGASTSYTYDLEPGQEKIVSMNAAYDYVMGQPLEYDDYTLDVTSAVIYDNEESETDSGAEGLAEDGR